MPDSSPLLISTLPPSRAQQRFAAAVAAALLAFFLAMLPFANAPLPRYGVVVPVVSTVMFLGDCISAVLLYGQFAVLRTRALLILAGGYLFTGLLVVAYALTFPGALSATGLLGAGLQTAAWIFVFWHLGLPIAVIAYALAGDAQVVQTTVKAAIATTAAIAISLAGLITWFATAYDELLPAVTVDAVRMSREPAILAAIVLLSAAAVVMIARRRRSVLDLWLLVVCFAWVLDSVFTYVTESRYTGAWYANRVVRIVAANIVLFVLLAETMRLYSKLASSVMARRRERESRMMTLEAMSAAIEHEVRQPLAAMAANAGAAQRWLGHSPPNLVEAREAMEDVVAEAHRATGILHSVRQLFARQVREMGPVDLNALIEETIALARIDLDRHAIGVQLDLDRSLPRINGNRNQLQEVIVNLTRNAGEAMRGAAGPPAVLRIGTQAMEGNKVEVSVADTGPGIDPQDMDRIFDPFFTTKSDGMGIGLPYCRSIAERHGGTLVATPALPRGSVFLLVLPCT